MEDVRLFNTVFLGWFVDEAQDQIEFEWIVWLHCILIFKIQLNFDLVQVGLVQSFSDPKVFSLSHIFVRVDSSLADLILWLHYLLRIFTLLNCYFLLVVLRGWEISNWLGWRVSLRDRHHVLAINLLVLLKISSQFLVIHQKLIIEQVDYYLFKVFYCLALKNGARVVLPDVFKYLCSWFVPMILGNYNVVDEYENYHLVLLWRQSCKHHVLYYLSVFYSQLLSAHLNELTLRR